MQNNIIETIKDQLECLGYRIEIEDEITLLAFHEVRSNLIVKLIKELLFVQTPFNHNTDMPVQNVIEIANEINALTLVTKWRISHKNDEKQKIDVERYSFGYDKRLFGLLLEQSEHEINVNMPKFVPSDANSANSQPNNS